MVLQVLDLTTSPRQTLRPEIHRRNIDVQFLAAGGPERAGYYNDDKTSVVDEDLLDTPRDILFYKDNQDAPRGHHRDGSRHLCGVFSMGCAHSCHPDRGCAGSHPQDCNQGAHGRLSRHREGLRT